MKAFRVAERITSRPGFVADAAVVTVDLGNRRDWPCPDADQSRGNLAKRAFSERMIDRVGYSLPSTEHRVLHRRVLPKFVRHAVETGALQSNRHLAATRVFPIPPVNP